MKRSSGVTAFAVPTRQSYVAIILIVYKTYRLLVKQAWPFLIYFFVGGGNKKLYVGGALAVLATIGLIVSVIKFFRYYFYIADDELIIEQGVLSRSKTNVPFDRVQTINFEQNIVHRIFDVVRLKVDTAGSVGNELEFQAIDLQSAEALRELLLSKKKSKKSSSNIEIEAKAVEEKTLYSTIMSLDVGQLLRAGMVENHLKSGGLIIAAGFWIWQGAVDIGAEDLVEGQVSQLTTGLILFGILAVAFIIISFLISLVRMVINNYDLKFMRSAKGFKINAGLFTKRDVSALDHKIQVVSWSDNPLKKLIGIKDLYLKQAGSKAINTKKSIRIPGCTVEHVDTVMHSLYGADSDKGIAYEHVHASYFYRIALYTVLLLGPIIGGLAYAGLAGPASAVSVVLTYILVTRYLSMRKKRFGYNDELLIIHGGAYGDKTTVLPVYKVQAVEQSSTPYQRRKGLASVTIHNASGRVTVPYINAGSALRMVDELLYKVERDHRKWM